MGNVLVESGLRLRDTGRETVVEEKIRNGGLPVNLGKSDENSILVDLEKENGITVVGDIGMGRTRVVKNLLADLLIMSTEKELQLYIIDTTKEKYKDIGKFKNVQYMGYTLEDFQKVLGDLSKEVGLREITKDVKQQIIFVVDEYTELQGVTLQDERVLHDIVRKGNTLGVKVIFVGDEVGGTRGKLPGWLVDNTTVNLCMKSSRESNYYRTLVELVGEKGRPKEKGEFLYKGSKGEIYKIKVGI